MIEAWQRCNHYRLALRNLQRSPIPTRARFGKALAAPAPFSGPLVWVAQPFKQRTQPTANGLNSFLPGALVACFQLIHGMYFISEHPAPPRDSSWPSVWTSAILAMAMGRNRSQANRTHDAKATLVHEITVCSFRSGIVSTNFSGNWASRRWLFQDKCPQGIS